MEKMTYAQAGLASVNDIVTRIEKVSGIAAAAKANRDAVRKRLTDANGEYETEHRKQIVAHTKAMTKTTTLLVAFMQEAVAAAKIVIGASKKAKKEA